MNISIPQNLEEQVQDIDILHWKALIAEGIRQAAAGEVIDGEEFLRSLEY